MSFFSSSFACASKVETLGGPRFLYFLSFLSASETTVSVRAVLHHLLLFFFCYLITRRGAIRIRFNGSVCYLQNILITR